MRRTLWGGRTRPQGGDTLDPSLIGKWPIPVAMLIDAELALEKARSNFADAGAGLEAANARVRARLGTIRPAANAVGLHDTLLTQCQDLVRSLEHLREATNRFSMASEHVRELTERFPYS